MGPRPRPAWGLRSGARLWVVDARGPRFPRPVSGASPPGTSGKGARLASGRRIFVWVCVTFRYYEEFPINLKTGEANLTQLYTQVTDARAGRARGSLASGQTGKAASPPGSAGLRAEAARGSAPLLPVLGHRRHSRARVRVSALLGHQPARAVSPWS